jgi:hypothetical protein
VNIPSHAQSAWYDRLSMASRRLTLSCKQVSALTKKRITRAVAPEEISDLLIARRWASLALVQDGSLHAWPTTFAYHGGRYYVQASQDDPLDAGTRVSLLIDDGVYHADLRGIRIQGTIGDPMADSQTEAGRDWLEVIPRKVTAWNYGAIRRRDP